MYLSATRIRVGMIILHDNELQRVTNVTHNTPGNKRGQVHVKMKRLKDGTTFEHRFRSDDSVQRATLEQREMQYLYSQDSQYYFMDTQTYDQIFLTDEMIGENANFLLPDTLVRIEFFENNPIGIELPKSVNLKVISTEASLKNATAQASFKPAKLETDLTVLVPPFIKDGDTIKVDTETGKYLERVNS